MWEWTISRESAGKAGKVLDPSKLKKPLAFLQKLLTHEKTSENLEQLAPIIFFFGQNTPSTDHLCLGLSHLMLV